MTALATDIAPVRNDDQVHNSQNWALQPSVIGMFQQQFPKSVQQNLRRDEAVGRRIFCP
jgi:hypothetical protein